MDLAHGDLKAVRPLTLFAHDNPQFCAGEHTDRRGGPRLFSRCWTHEGRWRSEFHPLYVRYIYNKRGLLRALVSSGTAGPRKVCVQERSPYEEVRHIFNGDDYLSGELPSTWTWQSIDLVLGFDG